MQLTKSKEKDVTVIAVSGEVDLNSSPKLRNEFHALLGAGVKKFVINFEGVSYIDSSGLATCIELVQELQANGGTLALVNLVKKIRNIFEVAKVDRLFVIHNTLDEAFAAI